MTFLRLPSIALLFVMSGCASWNPAPIALPDDLSLVQTQRSGGVEVSAAIPDAEQAKRHFGIDLEEQDLQAIWLRVSNSSDKNFWLLRTILDLDIYSPDEVAQMYQSSVPKDQFATLRQHLRDESMRVQIPAHSVNEGFVFVPRAYGGRYVDVRLAQDVYDVELARRASAQHGEATEAAAEIEMRFEYTIPLPDGMFDFEGLNEARIYADSQTPIASLDELRSALTELPCCSRNADGDAQGDPLNVVLIGTGENIMHALARAGWSFTHRLSLQSVSKLIGATLASEPYPVAPVSDLFLFDRKQDFALQRPRANIAQRNHMRLWLAPFRFGNKGVWVGQISRDIGIKLTTDSASLTTHIIDPDVDLAREYLLQSLLAGGFVDAFGFVSGASAASMQDPARNLTDDPYFSDGKRLVIILSPHPRRYSEVRSLLWERSGAPIAESQSQPQWDSEAKPRR